MISIYKWKALQWVVKWHLIMLVCIWEFLKTTILNESNSFFPKILLYKRYIDDIFMITNRDARYLSDR